MKPENLNLLGSPCGCKRAIWTLMETLPALTCML